MHYPYVTATVFSIPVCSIYIHNRLCEELHDKFMSCTIQNPQNLKTAKWQLQRGGMFQTESAHMTRPYDLVCISLTPTIFHI